MISQIWTNVVSWPWAPETFTRNQDGVKSERISQMFLVGARELNSIAWEADLKTLMLEANKREIEWWEIRMQLVLLLLIKRTWLWINKKSAERKWASALTLWVLKIARSAAAFLQWHHSATTRKSRPDSKTKSNSRISLSEASIANRRSSWNSRGLILWNRRLKLILSLRRVQMITNRVLHLILQLTAWWKGGANAVKSRHH